jgi:hypothetical protein
MKSAYYARLRRKLILREKRNKNASTNFSTSTFRKSIAEFRLNRRMILNRKRNVSSVTNNIANGLVSWSVLPRTTIPDAELFPSESNGFLTSESNQPNVSRGMTFKTILFVFFFFKSFIPIVFHI